MWLALAALLVAAGAQYKHYSSRSFPRDELMPPTATARASPARRPGPRASATRRSACSCTACSATARPSATAAEAPPGSPRRREVDELWLLAGVLRRAQCLRRCKQGLPAFLQAQPGRDLLKNFQRHQPYKYLQLAYLKNTAGEHQRPQDTTGAGSWHTREKAHNLPKAIAAAHTFLLKHPDDEMMQRDMAY